MLQRWYADNQNDLCSKEIDQTFAAFNDNASELETPIEALQVVVTLAVDILAVLEAHWGAVHVELVLRRHQLSIQAYQQAGETGTRI